MLKVGLTGNIGSGKTTVADIFLTLGIPVYPADEEAKKMYDIPSVRQKLTTRFGRGVMKGSVLNKRALAAIVFQHASDLKFLQDLVHPLVIADYQAWQKKQENIAYSILESAILFESGLISSFDKIILVSCPLPIRIDRIMLRDHACREEVLLRQTAQWDEESKLSRADFIIENSGRLPLIPQVMKIHQTLEGKD